MAIGLALVIVGVWVANASTVGRPEGCLAGCGPSQSRAPGPLRLVSLNVLHAFPTFERLAERLDLIAREIRLTDADLVLLQEVPWTPWIGSGIERLAAATGLNHVYLRANGNRYAIGFEEGSAILSRFALLDSAWVELEPRAGPFEHRIALAATADTESGPLRLVVTHLAGSSAAVNAGQAASLAAWLADQGGPMVIGGDFNASPNSETYAALPPSWTDAHRAVHPADPAPTCCVDDLTGAPGPGMERRVDYLFVAGGLRPVRAGLFLAEPVAVGDGWLRASDHAGLLVELAPS